MKKHIFIILLTALLLLAACQPTPDSPIVVGKDQSVMIEKAEATAAYQAEDPSAVDWYDRLGAPKQYATNLLSAGEHLTVDVNAPILLPDVELPVVRVSSYLFSDEDVHRFVTALLGDDPQCVDPWGENSRTKKSYEKEILDRKNALDHWNEYGKNVYGEYFETPENFEAYLNELMLKASNAPERPETFSPTYEWKSPNVWTKDGKQETADRYMTLLTVNDDLSQSRLDINRSYEFGRCSVRYLRDAYDEVRYPVDRRTWQNELSVSESVAKIAAEDLLDRMGLDHLGCAFSKFIRIYPGDVALEGNPYHACWAFIYTTEVNGAPLTYTAQTRAEVTDYNFEWEYEYCIVMVDEDGVAGLTYQNPCAVEEIEVPAATLLPFEKVREIFEKMVLIVDNNADTRGYDMTYRITSVRLGLASIPEQNGTGGLLVPVWDFMGVRIYPEYKERSDDETFSLLTINAIDGSIIVRS
jgi:hypothetical protein